MGDTLSSPGMPIARASVVLGRGSGSERTSAPLHTVAEALIDSLTNRYDVRVDEGLHVTADLPHPEGPRGLCGPCA